MNNKKTSSDAGCGRALLALIPIVVVIVLLIVAGIRFFPQIWGATFAQRTITVEEQPRVIIKCSSGTIIVEAGTSDTTVQYSLLPEAFNRKSNSMQHELDTASNIVFIETCNIKVTVPARSDLAIEGSEVYVSGITGVIEAHTNGGLIMVSDSQLKGKSKLETNGGHIYFDGQLDQEATTTFESNGGIIDVALPANASFNLNITGIIGSFITNFANLPAQDQPGIGEMQVKIGQEPRSTLNLDVNGTMIVLKAR